MVLAGVGGQGVLFATKILSETAAAKGFNILGSETHGMSQRGGSVASYLKIGDFSSPLVMKGDADFLYGFNPTETLRNLIFLRPGGVCFADAEAGLLTPSLKSWIDKYNLVLKTIPASSISLKLDAPKSANLVLLGFSSARQESPFSYDDLLNTIIKVTPSRFQEANLRCFQAGFNYH
jgi:indolepyruvate ferredoxin oxidoreductase beta subunit